MRINMLSTYRLPCVVPHLHEAGDGARSRSFPLLMSLNPFRSTPSTNRALYVVGPNDVLAITVYDQPQLSRTYMRARPTATLTFPLIGRVKSVGSARRRLRASYVNGCRRDILKDPQVTVIVDQYRSQQIFVMAKCASPGACSSWGR